MTKTKVLLFQFLIGRLKTKYFQQQKISAAKFQFLIDSHAANAAPAEDENVLF